MKRRITLIGALGLFLVLPSCQDDAVQPDPELQPGVAELGLTGNPTDPAIPPATVKPLEFFTFAKSIPEGTITPAEVYAVLAPGESFVEEKDVYLPAGILPEIADIMFAMDLTGSMGGELSNVKLNATNIMGALDAAIDDARFGVVSHMDYPDFTVSNVCGYSGTYGSSSAGDYAYSLDQPLTATIANVSTAITGLSLGFGADGPEDYTRVLYEAYADAAIGWRTDAAKFLLFWQDNVPHDCAFGLDCGVAGSTGPDPGRDETLGTADDLNLATVLAELDAAGVTLVSLHSGEWNGLWDCYADKTGGSSFQINEDGSIPGGTDIATFVLDKIAEVSQDIDVLELRPDAGYEAWFASTPIYDVDLSTTNDFTFDVTFTVPADQMPGIHVFQVCVFADGASLDVCQDVQIVVYDPDAGFVTGGGWIESQEGAYVPDPTLVGKASFGFVAKYKKGATEPDGNTEFQFHAADLNFHSDSYEWLVVTGADYARFKGYGTVNGAACPDGDPYRFMLWAGDDDPDTFRIRIWCEDEATAVETDLYDNGFDQAIAGGNIVVHTK